MATISHNAIKPGFFCQSGRNTREIEGEFHYYLKKQSQFVKGQISVNVYYTRDYRNGPRFRARKNKAKRQPLAGSSKHQALNPKRACLSEHDFAEQSQFVAGQINVNFSFTKDYERSAISDSKKTNPNKPNLKRLPERSRKKKSVQ